MWLSLATKAEELSKAIKKSFQKIQKIELMQLENVRTVRL